MSNSWCLLEHVKLMLSCISYAMQMMELVKLVRDSVIQRMESKEAA